MRANRAAIKAFRTVLRLSLRDLEQLSGVDRGLLSRIETGAVVAPTDRTVHAVADAMRIPVAAITYDTAEGGTT